MQREASILIRLKRVGSCMFCACGDGKERVLVYEKRKYLLSVLSKFVENSKILC